MNVAALKKLINERVRNKLPRIFNLSPAVMQLYRGGDWQTTFSIVNFPSFFSPQKSGVYNYCVSLLDENGKLCGTKTYSLRERGSAEIDPLQWVYEKPLIGIIKVEIQPPGLLFSRDKHLGVIRPQIYAHYYHANTRSVGIVHPQTAELTKSAVRPPWVSNQLLAVEAVTKVAVAQINPSPLQYSATLKLIDFETQETLLEVKVKIKAKGAALTELDVAKIPKNTKIVFLALDRLPGANAKPLLFVERNAQSYFVMHS